MTDVTFKIQDVFRLQDKTTVLAGELDRALLPRIAQCQAKLYVDGEYRQQLEIEGEVLLEGVPLGNHRGLVTRQDVNLYREEIATKECVLHWL